METTTSPLIPARNAAALLGRPDVVVVDARGGDDAPERYERGHLDGAVFFSLETDLSKKSPDAAKGGRHPLPDPRHFGIRLGKAGIFPLTHVLVYDDKCGANAAARFWWMMRAAGHTGVQVIDGGLEAIQRTGLALVTGPASPVSGAGDYPVDRWSLPLADMDMVDKARSAPNAVVVDVRENYRYRGENEPIDEIAGHIPGAINLPYTDNLQADGRFFPPEVLKEKYEAITGGSRDKNVIVHCGSGVTACHTLLGMASAGITNAKLYVGSWSEWSRNAKPVARDLNR